MRNTIHPLGQVQLPIHRHNTAYAGLRQTIHSLYECDASAGSKFQQNARTDPTSDAAETQTNRPASVSSVSPAVRWLNSQAATRVLCLEMCVFFGCQVLLLCARNYHQLDVDHGLDAFVHSRHLSHLCTVVPCESKMLLTLSRFVRIHMLHVPTERT